MWALYSFSSEYLMGIYLGIHRNRVEKHKKFFFNSHSYLSTRKCRVKWSRKIQKICYFEFSTLDFLACKIKELDFEKKLQSFLSSFFTYTLKYTGWCVFYVPMYFVCNCTTYYTHLSFSAVTFFNKTLQNEIYYYF